MASPNALSRVSFSRDLRHALRTADSARTTKTTRARDNLFRLWERFCQAVGCRSDLSTSGDAEARLAVLIVFAWRYRTGVISASGHPVRSQTVRDALLAVGQGISHLGQPDPRKPPGSEKLYPLLADFLSSTAREDSPATRSYPVNVTILRELPNVLELSTLSLACMDLAVMAFFFLCRPAEYTYSSETDNRSQSFRLQDVSFTLDNTIHPATTVPLNEENIQRFTVVSLTFSDQKNAVRGEQIHQRATSHPFLCPVKALGRRVRHLRQHNAPPETPLHTVYTPQLTVVTSKYITNALRWAAQRVEPDTGIEYELISTRSLRPGGATALLCANVDPSTIGLLGRWKSDAMLRYLRVAALVHTQRLSEQMLSHGDFSFAPGTLQASDLLPLETPPDVLHLARDPVFA